MDKIISREAQKEDVGERLDQCLNKTFPQYSRSYFNKLIKKGHVSLNGRSAKSGYTIREHDIIKVEFIEEQITLQPQDIELNIVFEDEHILIINKPAGLTVHPGKGQPDGTLVNALLNYTKKLGAGYDSDRPGIVHRLDKFTSGLLVVAKTTSALTKLQSQFQEKKISRIYQALAWGKFDVPEGTIHTFINRSKREPTKMTVTKDGREAITHFKVLQDFEYISLIQLKLETGRTHQIRVHLNYIHHPIVGDPDYHGRDSQLKRLPPQLTKRGRHLLKILDRQALHAKSLHLFHPESNEFLKFESELPENFAVALQKIPQLFLLTDE